LNVVFSVEVVPKDPLWKLNIAGVMVEKKGFDGIWVSDHFFNRNCFITLTLIALNTKRVILGPAVVNPYTVNPVVIAQMTATLWEVAPKRVRLALGAGDASALKQAGVERKKPVELVKETVYKIRSLLSSDEMSETYRPTGVEIYVGAQGPNMLRMAASHADGVLVNWSNLEKLKQSLSILNEAAGKKFRRGAYIITSVHDDEMKARKTAVPFAAYIMNGTGRQYLDEIGVDEELRQKVEKSLMTKNWDELYRLASGDWIDYFCLWGDRDKVMDFVAEVVGMGYDEVVFAGPIGPRYINALKDLSYIVSYIKGNKKGSGGCRHTDRNI